jgi:hypothetical protein
MSQGGKQPRGGRDLLRMRRSIQRRRAARLLVYGGALVLLLAAGIATTAVVTPAFAGSGPDGSDESSAVTILIPSITTVTIPIPQPPTESAEAAEQVTSTGVTTVAVQATTVTQTVIATTARAGEGDAAFGEARRSSGDADVGVADEPELRVCRGLAVARPGFRIADAGGAGARGLSGSSEAVRRQAPEERRRLSLCRGRGQHVGVDVAGRGGAGTAFASGVGGAGDECACELAAALALGADEEGDVLQRSAVPGKAEASEFVAVRGTPPAPGLVEVRR